MDDKLSKQILDELVQIRKLLTILSQDKLQSFNENIETTYLTTDQRKIMYDMFNGDNSYKVIADTIKVSSEAVRKFAIQLEKVGLIEHVTSVSKTKNPKRIF
jgi:predicted ArsR family transcriptional regulator